MIGADPRYARVVLSCRFHARSDLPQHLVAILPAEGVVDRLEAFDVQDPDGKLPVASGVADLLVEALHEQGPVGEAGELVVVGEMPDSLGFLQMIEGERDIAGELLAEITLLLVKHS